MEQERQKKEARKENDEEKMPEFSFPLECGPAASMDEEEDVLGLREASEPALAASPSKSPEHPIDTLGDLVDGCKKDTADSLCVGEEDNLFCPEDEEDEEDTLRLEEEIAKSVKLLEARESRESRQSKKKEVRRDASVKYSCPVCNRKFKRNVNLQAHMSSHKDEDMYECTLCGLVLPEEEFISHECAAVKDGKKSRFQKFPCSRCKRTFRDPRNLMNHRYYCHQGLHSKNSKIYIPPTKGEYFSLINADLIHPPKMTTAKEVLKEEDMLQVSELSPNCHWGNEGKDKPQCNSQEENGTCQCGECGRVFPGNKSLRNHQLDYYKAGRSCRPSFYMTEVCNGVMMLSCRVCGLKYRTFKELVAHVNSHNTRQFSCPHCNNTFKEEYAMTMHMLSHTEPEVCIMEEEQHEVEGDRTPLKAPSEQCPKDNPTESIPTPLCDEKVNDDRAKSDDKNSVVKVGSDADVQDVQEENKNEKDDNYESDVKAEKNEPQDVKDSECTVLYKSNMKDNTDNEQSSIKDHENVENIDLKDGENRIETGDIRDIDDKKDGNISENSETDINSDTLDAKKLKSDVKNEENMEFSTENVANKTVAEDNTLCVDLADDCDLVVECGKCKKRFPTEEELQSHVRTVGDEEILYCCVCFGAAHGKGDLDHHLCTHIEEEYATMATCSPSQQEAIDRKIKIIVSQLRGDFDPPAKVQARNVGVEMQKVTAGRNSLTCTTCGKFVHHDHSFEGQVHGQEDEVDDGDEYVYITRFSDRRLYRENLLPAYCQCNCLSPEHLKVDAEFDQITADLSSLLACSIQDLPAPEVRKPNIPPAHILYSNAKSVRDEILNIAEYEDKMDGVERSAKGVRDEMLPMAEYEDKMDAAERRKGEDWDSASEKSLKICESDGEVPATREEQPEPLKNTGESPLENLLQRSLPVLKDQIKNDSSTPRYVAFPMQAETSKGMSTKIKLVKIPGKPNTTNLKKLNMSEPNNLKTLKKFPFVGGGKAPFPNLVQGFNLIMPGIDPVSKTGSSKAAGSNKGIMNVDQSKIHAAAQAAVWSLSSTGNRTGSQMVSTGNNNSVLNMNTQSQRQLVKYILEPAGVGNNGSQKSFYISINNGTQDPVTPGKGSKMTDSKNSGAKKSPGEAHKIGEKNRLTISVKAMCGEKKKSGKSKNKKPQEISEIFDAGETMPLYTEKANSVSFLNGNNPPGVTNTGVNKSKTKRKNPDSEKIANPNGGKKKRPSKTKNSKKKLVEMSYAADDSCETSFRAMDLPKDLHMIKEEVVTDYDLGLVKQEPENCEAFIKEEWDFIEF